MNTSTYKYISTPEIMSTVETALFNAGHRNFDTIRTGSKLNHCIKYVLRDAATSLNGDDGCPMIVLFNSYNKSSAFMIGVGFYRFVCSNGLVVGTDFYHQRIIHRVGPKADNALDVLPDKVAQALRDIDGVLADIEEAAQQPVDFDRKIQIIGNLNISTPDKNTLIWRLFKQQEIAESEYTFARNVIRPEDRGDNVWCLWNFVQEQVTKGRTSMAAEVTNRKLFEDITLLAA